MKQQRGSALIISLLILLVMTIIGISAMSGSTLEEKMAASDRNQKAVFQNAENSLKQVETTLTQADYKTVIRPALVSDQTGYYEQDDSRFDYFSPSAWKPSGLTPNCIVIANNSNNNGSSCYIVEEVKSPIFDQVDLSGGYDPASTPELGNQITRITVRSTDSNNMSAVILQSNLQKTITY
jgi:type IV pilus assembly protein PilX